MQGSPPPYVTIISPQDSEPSSSNLSCLVQQPESSSNFFVSFKSLLQRPLSRSRSPRRSRSNDKSISESSDNENATRSRRSESRSRVLPRLRLKTVRAETSSVQDYLTLEQLEAIWRQQDIFTEPVDRDRESDLLEDLSDIHRGRQPAPSSSIGIHPALRPRHQRSRAEINSHRGWDRIPVSPID